MTKFRIPKYGEEELEFPPYKEWERLTRESPEITEESLDNEIRKLTRKERWFSDK